MAEKTLNTRIVQKHDIQENWDKALNFIPKTGEIIVYDADDNYSYARMKIGDGIHTINELPFSDDNINMSLNDLSQQIENVFNDIDILNTLVGDTSVSTQIDNALSSKQDSLTGTEGQFIQFDDLGSPIAIDFVAISDEDINNLFT